MSTTHKVRPGESLSMIAARYGFFSWKTLYDHPKNVELRKQREQPDLVLPGDQVFVPDKETKRIDVPTEAPARFVATAPKMETRLVGVTILVHGARTNASWFGLVVDDVTKKTGVKIVGDVEHREWFAIVPFTWGDYENRYQGGNAGDVDAVGPMFERPTATTDRVFMGHSAVRLKDLIDEARAVGAQVNVVSQGAGAMITAGALLLGAKLENWLSLGDPTGLGGTRWHTELADALKNVAAGGCGVLSTETDVASALRGVAEKPKREVVATQETGQKVQALLARADWRGVPFYKNEENVTLESGDMLAHAGPIARIRGQ
jgi:hypothetical protein